MDTEKEPRTSEVVWNSAMTLGIAGENMADAVGLRHQSRLNSKVRRTYVRKASAAIMAMVPNLRFPE